MQPYNAHSVVREDTGGRELQCGKTGQNTTAMCLAARGRRAMAAEERLIGAIA